MSREEHLAQRQQTYQLAADFSRALARAYDAINTGKPLDEANTLSREAFSLSEAYEVALDRLLFVLEQEPGDNEEEIGRTWRFKEVLQKEQQLLQTRLKP